MFLQDNLYFLLFVSAIFFTNFSFFNLVLKLFKINKINKKISLLIFSLQLFAILIPGILFAVILDDFVSCLLSFIVILILGVFIFHKLMSKYYKTSLKKNILIYVFLSLMTLVYWILFTHNLGQTIR